MISVTVQHLKNVDWGIKGCCGALLACYTIIYFVYIAMGALVFMEVERETGTETLLKKIDTVKEGILKKYPNTPDDALEDFLSQLSAAGIGNIPNRNIGEPKWSFSQAVLFCTTVVTTIGYGHIAPQTEIGKIFCILFTVIGIPFTVSLQAAYIFRLMSFARIVYKALLSCLRSLLKPISIQVLLVTIMFVSTAALFFLLPATLFWHVETSWTYLDSLYFCFISLTTVGLGDFVAGKDTDIYHKGLYRIFVSIYLLIGVLSVMFVVALMTQFSRYILENKRKDERPLLTTQLPNYGSIYPDQLEVFSDMPKTLI